MELAASSRRPGAGHLTMHVNKVHHVTTINRVAQDLGEDPDWLYDVALEMEIEDGVIWIYGVNDLSVLAFSDFGIDRLTDLIKIYKKTHRFSKDEVPGGPRGLSITHKSLTRAD
jgi:hypothetical protein